MAHECEYIKEEIKKRYMYIVAERDGVSESLENTAYKANTQSLANFWDKDEILLKNVQELLIIQFFKGFCDLWYPEIFDFDANFTSTKLCKKLLFFKSFINNE